MYNVGQRVKMNDTGFVAYGVNDSNPRGVLGTVTGPDEYDEEFTNVDWDNGFINSYENGTLDIIEDME